MKIQYYIILLLVVTGLFACNTGKHYFKKRIDHRYEEPVSPKQEIKNLQETSLMVLPVEAKNIPVESFCDEEKTVSAYRESFKPMGQESGSGLIQPGSESLNLDAQTDEAKTVFQKPAGGNDKEGFILLLILAGLLVGLGLLFYFMIPAVGLVLLIVFSIVAGIVLVLVLLALIF